MCVGFYTLEHPEYALYVPLFYPIRYHDMSMTMRQIQACFAATVTNTSTDPQTWLISILSINIAFQRQIFSLVLTFALVEPGWVSIGPEELPFCSYQLHQVARP